VLSVRYADSDYPFGIFWPLCCLFDMRILITPLVSFGHCVVCSIYGFWLPLWYLLAIVLSVRYTDSDYPFGIFKLFLLVRKPECRIKPLTCRYSLTLYHMMLYRVHLAWAGFELTTLVAIGTDCICCYTSNYQTMTTKTGWCYMVVYHQAENIIKTYNKLKILIILNFCISHGIYFLIVIIYVRSTCTCIYKDFVYLSTSFSTIHMYMLASLPSK
jgi:hypothetical protein